jgi:tRNA pseudouridine55 synthase
MMTRPEKRLSKPAPPGGIDPSDGVLLVDKPSGPTSHDIVDRIRNRFGFKKVGHGGTLDPQATGLLVILVGRGTKLSNQIIGSDKSYEGAMKLGVSTDSQDAQGRIIREEDSGFVTREMLEAEMCKFTGDIMQTPPMVSAVKVKGVPLYKRARKGHVVEREPKLIHVYRFEIIRLDLPRAFFAVECTKGTYVRTLCSDVGDNLGCGAHLEELCRTRCGNLHLKDAVSMAEILEMSRTELTERIVPLSRFSPKVAGGR